MRKNDFVRLSGATNNSGVTTKSTCRCLNQIICYPYVLDQLPLHQPENMCDRLKEQEWNERSFPVLTNIGHPTSSHKSRTNG